MFTKILNISMRSTLIVVVLLILTRLLGKKQMSQLTYFNYITGVTMGSVAGDFISEVNMPVVDALASLIAICILTELNSFIALKVTTTRSLWSAAGAGSGAANRLVCQHGWRRYNLNQKR